MKDLFEYLIDINSLYNIYINENKEQYEKYITTSGIHLGAGGKCGWFATAEECLKFFLIEKTNKNEWKFIDINDKATDEQIYGLNFRKVIFKKTADPNEIADFIIKIYDTFNKINNDNINGKNAPLIFSSRLKSYLLSTRPKYVGLFDNIIDNYKNIIKDNKIDKLKEGHAGFGGEKTGNGLEYENIIKTDIKNNIIKLIIKDNLPDIKINNNLSELMKSECVKNCIQNIINTKDIEIQYDTLFNELDNYIYLTGNKSPTRLSSGIINEKTCEFNKDTMNAHINESIINMADIIIVSNTDIINSLKLSKDGNIKAIIKLNIKNNIKNNIDYALISVKLKDHQNSTMSFSNQFKYLQEYIKKHNNINNINYIEDNNINIFMKNFCNLFCICNDINNEKNAKLVNNIINYIINNVPDQNKNQKIIYNVSDIKQGNVNYTNLSSIINFLYGYNYWFVKQNSPAVIKDYIDLSSLKFELIKLANYSKSSIHIYYSYANNTGEYLHLEFRTDKIMKKIPDRLYISKVKNIPGK